MYTFVAVAPHTGGGVMTGHSYDISEGGVQFELDYPIVPGTPVSIEIKLPGPGEQAIAAYGNIVWMDDSEPGPVRMAMTFSGFAHERDRERLLEQVMGRGARKAA